MAKYHVNPKTGNPGVCNAKVSCPFGGDEKHFDSKEEARKVYELEQEAITVPFKPELSHGSEIRFGKLTSSEEIKKLGATLRNIWQSKPDKKIKIKDRYGYGTGVYALSYDVAKGEFSFEKHHWRIIYPLASSRNLTAILTQASGELGYAEHEKETLDWDA